MASLFRNKYRIESSRYQGYDYSLPGKYFITICTKNKIHYFGEIDDGKMILSETGLIVRDFWIAIPYHFPHTLLDEFIIMPDHIHGIIIIKSAVQTPKLGVLNRTPKLGVPTESSFNARSSATPNLGLPTESSSNTRSSATPKLGVATTNGMIKPGNPSWKSNSIGSIVNQFKRICTITTKTNELDLIWQTRFYDRIIRSSSEFNRIRKYIINNPVAWKKNLQ